MKLMAFLAVAALVSLEAFRCSTGAQKPTATSTYSPVTIIDSVTPEQSIVSFFNTKSNLSALNFPIQTQRMYQRDQFKYVWFNRNRQEILSNALMLLDCVVQYGLIPSAYHPQLLNTNNLKAVIEDKTGSRLELKARFDIFLTDALLSFINHLHYGRFNPYVSQKQMDAETAIGFKADIVLDEALKSDFKETILNVQPSNPGYRSLQRYMRLTTGQYVGDCYEISEDSLKLVALNMERYKWYRTAASAYLEVNIPSFTLNFYQGSSAETFRVIVGKPTNPTPTLISEVSYLNTAPDWSVPPRIFRNEILPKILADPSYADRNHFAIYSKSGKYISLSSSNIRQIREAPGAYFARQSSGCDNALGQIVFHFQNRYSIYLHDTPNRSLFSQANRALSHGCIRVDKPDKLAQRILVAVNAPPGTYQKVADAMQDYRKFRYTFTEKIPIIIRYITCEIKDGMLVTHKDIYRKDPLLLARLFKSTTFVPSNN